MGFFRDTLNLWQNNRQINIEKSKQELIAQQGRSLAMQVKLDTAQEFLNSGYSHGGASRSGTWSKGYHAESLSPRSDIEENRKTLRQRSRDLAMNAPIGTAAINSTRTSCIGSGLSPKPKIDYEFLGMSKDNAIKLQQNIKKEFALWSQTTLCDVCDLNNFAELQQIVFNDWLRNGESFALIKYGEPLPYMPYKLRIKLVSADRVCTPNSLDGDYDGEDKRVGNNKIMNGVEIDPDGKVVAYHICSHFPGEYDTQQYEWARVEKRGKRTGNHNVLHVFNAETSEQYRGVPFLAPVIMAIKQLTRYTDAEIMAAVINSMFSLFVSTETGDDLDGFGGVEDDDWDSQIPVGENEIKLGSGTINFLKEGEKVEAVESQHPNGNYESFMGAFTAMIGSALEIAPEVLMKKFQNSFSASKGALNETWRSFTMRRKWFVDDFCQQVYELWFAEAVSMGRINAPGFFLDPLIRKAYTNATWTGPAQGCLNPLQEANAAVIRINNGLSTREDECAAINGTDYEDNVRTLINENERLADANKFLQQPTTGGIEDAEED